MLEHSRALRLAESVSKLTAPDLEAQLNASTVAVSADPSIPGGLLTARTLLTTLRRGPGALVLMARGLPREFVAAVEAATARIDADRPLIVLTGSAFEVDGSVRIHVGPSASQGIIRIVPEGYGGHVAGAVRAVIRIAQPATALGAIYTAALGAAEVFKITAGVLPSRRVLHRHLRFCPVSLSSNLSAPREDTFAHLDLSLVGIGAIGTGIVLLLDAMEVEGRIVVVDPETFGPENLGTYSLGTRSDAEGQLAKVAIAQLALPRCDVIPVRERVADMIRLVDAGEVPWTSTVVSALDSPDARRDAQRLWPDRLIDAATGDTMLGRCDHRHGVDPCMMCVFPVDRTQPSGAEAVASKLGLPAEVLADAVAVLTEDHLRRVSKEQEALLRPHAGQPVCGLARATGLSAAAERRLHAVCAVRVPPGRLSRGGTAHRHRF